MKTNREIIWYMGMDTYKKWEQYIREHYEYHKQLRMNKRMKVLSIVLFALYAVNFFAFCYEGMRGVWGSAFFFLFLSIYFSFWGAKSILSIK